MLDLHLRPSLILKLVLVAAHLLSLGLVWLMPLATVMQSAASLLLATSLLHTLYHDGLLAASDAIVCLRFLRDTKCQFQTRAGNWFDGQIMDSSMISPWFCLLKVKTNGHLLSRHVVIFPDSATAEEQRQLRVWLRWKSSDCTG